MIFDPSTADHLKPWLTKTLEPICDADPDALADYILALLKHNAPENDLRKELASQLDEFLEKEGPGFINTLFTALRTKSYLPYTASPLPPTTSQSVDTGIPIPLDALMATSSSPQGTRKRGSDYDEDMRPAKGPRLEQDSHFSRQGPSNGRGGYDGRGNGHWRGGGPGRGGYGGGMSAEGNGMNLGGMNMNGGAGMNGMGYRPPDPKRGICRDYHNNGYCARGAYCKYSHGEDAVIPGMFPLGPQMQGNMFMPMFPNGGAMPFGMGGGAPAAYDPHERLDMRAPPAGPAMGPRPPRQPAMPRNPVENGDGRVLPPPSSGELPVIQDLTPQGAKDDAALPPPNGPPIAVPAVGRPSPMPTPPSGPSSMDMDSPMEGPSQHGHFPQQQGRGFRPPRGRGAGRPGVFGGDVQRFRPERRDDKTLVVEKIPGDKLSLDSVNGWFKKFGTVTNVAIDAPTLKALVSFSTHEEAHAAWKSEDAVFGNRFVKLFWHRPMDGQGQIGQRMLAASANIVASVAGREHAPAASTSAPEGASQQSPPPPATPRSRKPSATSKSDISALAAKQQLLEQQIAEQKTLMDKLKTASPEEKKELFARLRKLGEEMKASTTPPSATAAVPVVVKVRASATPHPEDPEQKEKERLDKELELHSVTNTMDTEDESTEALKAKLAKLKAEAASLGIDEALPSTAPAPYGYPTFRGRGRGRARGYNRGAMRGGHGGPPRASMKLDNRPRKLVVKDVASSSLQAVRDWYETTGQVESVETLDSGDVVVSFRTRSAAEQGLAKGTEIPLAGKKQISWFTASSAPPPKPAPKVAAVGTSVVGKEEVRMEDDFGHTASVETPSHGGDDEYAVSGWGDADEDGMGML
ncbi:hypothetical protein FA95DRAFT_1490904 [Auriscalpium vulgare]|uniref:Uncharacterized protein n=1 Tax=Auriscalpium vulgare TaxID=40419 RepID=A0ACB8RWM2_9AGAM|nr:hypothetical protein FA95DRAFT_1490904 [Auriscalpium vulgare]